MEQDTARREEQERKEGRGAVGGGGGEWGHANTVICSHFFSSSRSNVLARDCGRLDLDHVARGALRAELTSGGYTYYGNFVASRAVGMLEPAEEPLPGAGGPSGPEASRIPRVRGSWLGPRAGGGPTASPPPPPQALSGGARAAAEWPLTRAEKLLRLLLLTEAERGVLEQQAQAGPTGSRSTLVDAAMQTSGSTSEAASQTDIASHQVLLVVGSVPAADMCALRARVCRAAQDALQEAMVSRDVGDADDAQSIVGGRSMLPLGGRGTDQQDREADPLVFGTHGTLGGRTTLTMGDRGIDLQDHEAAPLNDDAQLFLGGCALLKNESCGASQRDREAVPSAAVSEQVSGPRPLEASFSACAISECEKGGSDQAVDDEHGSEPWSSEVDISACAISARGKGKGDNVDESEHDPGPRLTKAGISACAISACEKGNGDNVDESEHVSGPLLTKADISACAISACEKGNGDNVDESEHDPGPRLTKAGISACAISACEKGNGENAEARVEVVQEVAGDRTPTPITREVANVRELEPVTSGAVSSCESAGHLDRPAAHPATDDRKAKASKHQRKRWRRARRQEAERRWAFSLLRSTSDWARSAGFEEADRELALGDHLFERGDDAPAAVSEELGAFSAGGSAAAAVGAGAEAPSEVAGRMQTETWSAAAPSSAGVAGDSAAAAAGGSHGGDVHGSERCGGVGGYGDEPVEEVVVNANGEIAEPEAAAELAEKQRGPRLTKQQRKRLKKSGNLGVAPAEWLRTLVRGWRRLSLEAAAEACACEVADEAMADAADRGGSPSVRAAAWEAAKQASLAVLRPQFLAVLSERPMQPASLLRADTRRRSGVG